jgi:hypothetical protein
MSNTRSGRQAAAALSKKGFQKVLSGKHIRYFLSARPGEPELDIRTMISHGMDGSTLSADLINKMANQLRLMKAQFLDFIDCRMSEEKYRKVVEESIS